MQILILHIKLLKNKIFSKIAKKKCHEHKRFCESKHLDYKMINSWIKVLEKKINISPPAKAILACEPMRRRYVSKDCFY